MFWETKNLMNIIKYIIRLNISKPNGNHHNYINIRLNLSTAANSIDYDIWYHNIPTPYVSNLRCGDMY